MYIYMYICIYTFPIGMGTTTITAARFFKAKRDSTSIEKTHLAWDKFSHTGLSKVYFNIVYSIYYL